MATILKLDRFTFPGLCMVMLEGNCGVAYIELNSVIEYEHITWPIAENIRNGSIAVKDVYMISLRTDPRTNLLISSESFLRIVTELNKFKNRK